MANEWPLYLWSCRTAFGVVERMAPMMYKHVKSVRDVSAAGDTPRTQFEALVNGLSARIDEFTLAKNTPGIAAYAQNEMARIPNFDAADSFTQLLNTMVATRDWIQVRLDNNPGVDTFTTAQTAGFRTVADALLARMDVTPNG